MSVIPLIAARRGERGKGAARKTRAAGRIPAVLYGRGAEAIPVAIESRDFELAMRKHKGGNPIVGLTVEGSEYTALIRDVQYDPVTRGIIHLDFQRISLTETVEVDVAVRLTGLAVGVKDAGGILEPILRDVKVRCLPTAIPSAIEVDVSALNIGDSIHVRDIVAPEVTILNDPDSTVATVVPPTVTVEEKPAEEAAAAAATAEPAEPEVIAKGRKEEAGEEEKEKEKETEKKEERKEKKEK